MDGEDTTAVHSTACVQRNTTADGAATRTCRDLRLIGVHHLQSDLAIWQGRKPARAIAPGVDIRPNGVDQREKQWP